MKVFLEVFYPAKISKYFEMVINDYSIKPDKIIWTNTASNREAAFQKGIKYECDFLITHQFYKFLGRNDLALMLLDLQKSKDDIFCIGMFPRTLNHINSHQTEIGEEITHNDGTTIYKMEHLRKIMCEMEKMKGNNSEEKYVKALQILNYKPIFAPYVREYYLPGSEMISETNNVYPLKNF